MEVNEHKSDFATFPPKSDSISNNRDTISNDASSELLENNKQNTEKLLMEDTSNSSQNETDDTCKQEIAGFKKPLLIIGPRRGKIGKIRSINDNKPVSPMHELCTSSKIEIQTLPSITKENIDTPTPENIPEESIMSDEKNVSVPYLEPTWSGKPEKEYKLEVLKSGIILETIDLTGKSFHVIGRLPTCNLSLAHPTISRYHAIIQYRATEDGKNSKGLYLYDLESTHGTFWNGHRIKPRAYVRLYGGHMIRFGCSQRKYIIQAPPDDQEEESELSVTQLKEKRLEELREREIKQQEDEEAEKEEARKQEESGIDWGMAEDADEETDLTENPYASLADEELYLDDPKKTLRGWFEREGYDLQYQVEEKGIGQFLCWIILPKEIFGGRSIKAEALVKGKKKESVVQCALEACRILDRHGLLRQANHEARKRKTRNWEEEDYYDSDEDNFLDRTGTIERKREHRMKLAGKFDEQVETYSSLTKQHTEIVNKISHLNNCLKQAQESNVKNNDSEDSLDAFMSNLNSSSLSKTDVTKIKIELQTLHKKEISLVKLINLTKPADLPPLVSHTLAQHEENNVHTTKLSKRNISQFKKRTKFLAVKVKDDSNKVVHSIMDYEEEDDDNDKEEGEDSTCIDDGNSFNTKTTQNIDDAHDTNVNKPEYENPTLYKDKKESENNAESYDRVSNSIDSNEDSGTSEIIANVTNDKKRKKDKKTEKSLKNIKIHYDKEAHSEDYSTWLPPQDQCGDGRTTLNDKYGY